MEIKTTPAWTVTPNGGWSGLKLSPAVPLPDSLGEGECLVEIHAVSINYRDIAIPMGAYPSATRDGIVPCSDAVGVVLATGPVAAAAAALEFRPGDRVCTVFNPAHQSGRMEPPMRQASLGNVTDGTLRRYAVFREAALVHAPATLDDLQAATLSCAAVTAWNVLFGLPDRALRPGDWVLTQGTGGVSLFAIQLALALGANVVATTSSADKERRLRALGVQHVVNYREDPTWGETAKKLTPGGFGVDHVVEVGGETTMGQSLKAVRMEGVISLVGFLGGAASAGERNWSFADCIMSLPIIRGMAVGSKEQFKACNEFIDRHEIKPFVGRAYQFEDALEAFRSSWEKTSGDDFGKVVIKLNE